MPKWRPVGMSREQIYAQDQDCFLRPLGMCFVPDEVESVVGVNEPHALSLDHIYEQVRHGPINDASNLLTMHRHCNRVRGCVPFVKFIGERNAEEIARLFPRVAPTICSLLGRNVQ